VTAARQCIAAVVAALTLTACAGDGSNTASSAARNEAVVRMGVVESVREVSIDGGSGYAGAVAGGAVGGVAGAKVGGGSGASVSSVLGAVAGSLAGQALEQQAGKKSGVEITVRLESGELRAVTQEAGEVFKPGEPVRLLFSRGVTRVSH
jgi:outer membrane lipoprotein SlyB